MSKIVIDLEWNQAVSSHSSIYNRLPIHLLGEIIEIGAVKLDDNNFPTEEFKTYVRPIWFKKMHNRVKQITGITDEMLQKAPIFPDALDSFLAWAGTNSTFITWGFDDHGIMEQNCIIHDLDIEWMGNWYNLQLIFNQQNQSDSNQKSLETAMAFYGIEQTRIAHDALGDAFNTAVVASKLDLDNGLYSYNNFRRKLSIQKAQLGGIPSPIEHILSDSYNKKEELWADPSLTQIICPKCNKILHTGKWINQGDNRYMTLAECKDNAYLLRLKLRHNQDDTWSANRSLYIADDSMIKKYKSKEKNNSSNSHKRFFKKLKK